MYNIFSEYITLNHLIDYCEQNTNTNPTLKHLKLRTMNFNGKLSSWNFVISFHLCVKHTFINVHQLMKFGVLYYTTGETDRWS